MARRTSPAGTGTQRPGRKTPGGKVSAQFQICALLMAEGDLTRAELASKVDVSADSALTNAIFNAKNLKRITKDKGTGKYSITKTGREWANGGSNLDNQRRSTTSPAAVKRARREPAQRGSKLPKGERERLGVVDVTPAGNVRGGLRLASDAGAAVPAPIVPQRSFRCAIGSDRSYTLRKGGVEIELTEDETLEMLRYVDRVRGMDAPAAGAAA